MMLYPLAPNATAPAHVDHSIDQQLQGFDMLNAIRVISLFAVLLLSGCFSHPTMTVTKDGQSAKVYVTPRQDRTYADGSRMNWVDVAHYKSLGALPAPIKKPPMFLCLMADALTTVAGLSTGNFVELNPLGPYGAGALATGTYGYLKANDDGSDYQLNLQYLYANTHCIAALANGGTLGVIALLL
jgi:uncharacterized protein YceK